MQKKCRKKVQKVSFRDSAWEGTRTGRKWRRTERGRRLLVGHSFGHSFGRSVGRSFGGLLTFNETNECSFVRSLFVGRRSFESFVVRSFVRSFVRCWFVVRSSSSSSLFGRSVGFCLFVCLFVCLLVGCVVVAVAGWFLCCFCLWCSWS